MRKTTVYLPENLLAGVKTVAAVRRCSEAEVIRSALERELALALPHADIDFGMLSRDFGPLGLDLAHVDNALDGFGRDE